jgi:hypothetical protein
MSEHLELYEAGKRATRDALLEAANTMAETINAALMVDAIEDKEIRFYRDTMNLLRDMADKISPPEEVWPAKVIPLARQRKRRK